MYGQGHNYKHIDQLTNDNIKFKECRYRDVDGIQCIEVSFSALSNICARDHQDNGATVCFGGLDYTTDINVQHIIKDMRDEKLKEILDHDH